MKEYAYCPRIAYFKMYTIFEVPTESMAYAKGLISSVQDVYEAVKHRLGNECSIEIDRYVRSRSLGIHGYVDALAICPREAVPIEIKLRSSPKAVKRFALHHLVQLVGYAIAVEETLEKPVYRAIVLSLEPRSVFEIAVSPRIREMVYRCVKEVRRMFEEERVPRPTSSRARCSTCFYKSICVRT